MGTYVRAQHLSQQFVDCIRELLGRDFTSVRKCRPGRALYDLPIR